MKKLVKVAITIVALTSSVMAVDICQADKNGDPLLYAIADSNDAVATEEAIVEVVGQIKELMAGMDAEDMKYMCSMDIPTRTGSMARTMANAGKIPPGTTINVSSLQGGKTGITRNATISTPYLAINISKYVGGCSGGKASKDVIEDMVLKNIVLRVWFMKTFSIAGAGVGCDDCYESESPLDGGLVSRYSDFGVDLANKLVRYKNKGIFELLEIFGAQDQSEVFSKLLRKPGVRQISERIKSRVDSISVDEEKRTADEEAVETKADAEALKEISRDAREGV